MGIGLIPEYVSPKFLRITIIQILFFILLENDIKGTANYLLVGVLIKTIRSKNASFGQLGQSSLYPTDGPLQFQSVISIWSEPKGINK